MHVFRRDQPVVTHCPSETTYEAWINIPIDKKLEAGQLLRICAFWDPILLERHESHGTTRWARHVGFISSLDSDDLSLKQLNKIETLEAILRAMEKGCVSWLLSASVFVQMFPSLLSHICTLFQILAVFHVPLLQKCEEMKNKGNEKFQKNKYEEAVEFYSKAINFYPGNHLIYGNRALCYIRCKKYLNAVGDGKRATLLKPVWAKGHYRYCEALFCLGEFIRAIEANKQAQILCKDSQEGIKDLEQQYQRFISVFPEIKGTCTAMLRRADQMFLFIYCHQAGDLSYCICPSPSYQKVAASSTGVCQALRSAVQDGHSALVDLRSRSAEQAFRKALAILETSTPKTLLVKKIKCGVNVCFFLTQELTEAQNVLEKIKLFEERTFECLVYYGIGKVYLKENRYPYALRQFSDALQMVKNQITPGKLTWPMTKEIVKETQLDYFKELLFNVIDLCKFPPTPQAICRLENCLGPLKAEIYFTDPDFKGFIRIGCCQSCIVEYHITCWKALKSVSFSDKNEKDFLQEPCFTPDCGGQICCIKIFGSTGLIKCKVRKIFGGEADQKKLKSKEERKLRRMQHRLSSYSCCFNLVSVMSAWLLYRDRVLLQISQNMEVLRVEKNVHVEDLASSLKPWLELDLSRGNQLAERMLSWQQQPEQTLDQAVEMILERKNRVWARVFLQCLSNSLDINPKLLDWARHLNDAGLNAAKSFIERHAGHLEELDLALLLKFGPLQDLILEKLGTRPEVFTKIGLTVTDYLKQAPSQDMRLFIWTLEEHRDQYVSCHNILDEYFEMMGKSKNRGRKKKKESKGVIVLSGMRGATPRDEWDQDFFDEDDSLSVLHPGDPFSVPSHLREHVADFEEQYNATNHRSLYKKILDNNPDPAKENLYDYFAQILEEHGPLCAQDPLLVGELDNFPAVAQEKIQEAGGFESFLLESLRFIKMGQRIGLAKHAVCLQQAGHGSSLDDLDDITDADISSSAPSMYACHDVFTNYLQDYSSMENDYEKINLRRKEAITSLEEDLQRISTNIQVTNTELALFQQKLEEEVKKDQKEKKGNQEALKSLKTEIEQLVEEQESLTRNIRQKNMKYQTQLNDFLELSNQSAAKRMSLEDEIKRCKDLCTKAKRRSQTAQVGPISAEISLKKSLLHSHQDAVELFWLLFVCFHVCIYLMMFIQDLRSANGGSLSSMALQDVVNGVTQLILDQQVGKPMNPAISDPNCVCACVCVVLQLNMEDPCIICHDDMSPDDVCVLECRHSFHRECIKSWLKEQSTCPTCREHALLPEDFPMLPGRRRRAHNPAAV
uniref:RING-type E3 ubiquitin transferase n=1 Tax=Myripristis murdjan TaxID=586833 RepID=A0A667Y0B7_9TELE